MDNIFSKGIPLTVIWHFTRPDGAAFDIGGYQYRLFYGVGNRYTEVSDTRVSENTISWVFPAERQTTAGPYSLRLLLFQNGNLLCTFNYNNAFAFFHGNSANTLQEDEQVTSNTVDLFTAAEFYLFSPVIPTVGHDGYWYVNGTRVTDGNGQPVPSSHTVEYDSRTNYIIIDRGRVDKDGNSIEQMITSLASALSTAASDHSRAQTDHGTASSDHTTAGRDHDTAESDHDKIESLLDGYNPIVINGDVTNAPDEEDITSDSNNLLKIKDRGVTYGMGYKILRRNKTFAEQVTEANTIYEIRYDFSLGNESVSIPSGCTLKFVGGKVSNGTVVGNQTRIDNRTGVMFSNITISGTWNVDEVFPEWFGAVGDGSTNDRIAIQNAINMGDRIVMKNNYLVVNAPFDYTNYDPIPEDELDYYQNVLAQKNSTADSALTPILVGSNKEIVISGTVKAYSPLGILFKLEGNNTVFTGGGTVCGCGVVCTVNVYSGTPSYDVTNWEAALIYIKGSHNRVEHLTIKDPTRQGVSIDDYLSKGNVICNNIIGGGLKNHTESVDTCSFTGLFGIYARGTNTVVRDNVFKKINDKCVYDALYCNYTTEHVPVDVEDRMETHTTFDNNKVDGVLEHAIYSYAANLRITDNSLKADQTALQLFNKRQFVNNNRIVCNDESSAIYVSGENQIITNNKLYHVGRYGIRCGGYYNGSCDYDYVANNYIEKTMAPFSSANQKTTPAISFESTVYQQNKLTLEEITCENNVIICMDEAEDARTTPINGLIAVYADSGSTIKRINIINNTVRNSNVANNICVVLNNSTRDSTALIKGNVCINTYPIFTTTPTDPILRIEGLNMVCIEKNRFEQLGETGGIENAGSAFWLTNVDTAILSGNKFLAKINSNNAFFVLSNVQSMIMDGTNEINGQIAEKIVTVPANSISAVTVPFVLPLNHSHIEITPVNNAARDTEAENPLVITNSYIHSIKVAHAEPTEFDTIYRIKVIYF